MHNSTQTKTLQARKQRLPTILIKKQVHNTETNQTSALQNNSIFQVFINTLIIKKYLNIMGTTCACLKEYNSEDNQLSIEKEEISKQGRPTFTFTENNNFPKSNSINLIKLQSLLRGYLQRKRTKEVLHKIYSARPPISKPVVPRPELQQELQKYSNPATLAAERRCGPFTYQNIESDGVKTTLKPATVLENGAVYIGDWNDNNERHGKGMQLWNDCSKYEGYWKYGKANGKGRLIHGDGDVYEGEWKNDKAHGFGVYIHTDGAKYEGMWIEDKQYGEGVENWPDGSVYKGQYINGKKHGKGHFAWSDGSTYDGEFIENDINGFGIYKWNDGRVFEGYWKNNKMDGKGVFVWPDGRTYKGAYVDDKKQGYGIFEWPDGKRYEGMWLDGKQHGRGVFINTNNEKKEGIWKEGRRVKNLEQD